MNSLSRRNFLIASSIYSTSLLGFCGQNSFKDFLKPDWAKRLYTPTQFVKIDNFYFIVDCWHHRILYSKTRSSHLPDWTLLDDDIAGPHSIASDGSLFVAEDTGRNGLKVYTLNDFSGLSLVQYVENIGIRPHRVIYDKINNQFLIVCSNDQSIWFAQNINGKLTVTSSHLVSALNGQYCRSITIKDDVLYFVGVHDIILYKLQKSNLGNPIRRIVLHENFRGSNDLFFLNESGGYLTCTPQRIFQFNDISSLEKGDATDLSSYFDGTPYYVEQFDNQIWIPENTQYSALNSFGTTNQLVNKVRFMDFGAPNELSIQRKNQLPV